MYDVRYSKTPVSKIPSIKTFKGFFIFPRVIITNTAPLPYIGQSGPFKKPLLTKLFSSIVHSIDS